MDAGDSSSYPGSGTTWTDTTGGKVFTLFNGPTYSPAYGGYINFVAASSQYATATSFSTTFTQHTIEVWHFFNSTFVGAAPVIFGEGRSASASNFIVGCTGGQTNKVQGGYWTGAWQQGTTAGDHYTIPGSGWYQFVYTFDGNTINFYSNNSLKLTKVPANKTPVKSGLGLNIMRRQDVANYWGGGVSIIRVYDRALTVAEINQNYSAISSRYGY
jgi:hypothetical protein